MGIPENTDGSARTQIWAGVERQMKGLTVGPVNNRRVLGHPNKDFSAVSACGGVSLHRNTPRLAPIIMANLTEHNPKHEKRTLRNH
jgi:hypothetical protein